MSADVQFGIFLLFWISLGGLFGGMLVVTALISWLVSRRRPGAGMAALVLGLADFALIFLFFVWPLRISNAIMFSESVGYFFFGTMAAVVILLLCIFLLGRPRAEEVPKEPAFS